MGAATGCQFDVIAHVTVCFGPTEWTESLLHSNNPTGMYPIPQLTTTHCFQLEASGPNAVEK